MELFANNLKNTVSKFQNPWIYGKIICADKIEQDVELKVHVTTGKDKNR